MKVNKIYIVFKYIYSVFVVDENDDDDDNDNDNNNNNNNKSISKLLPCYVYST